MKNKSNSSLYFGKALNEATWERPIKKQFQPASNFYSQIDRHGKESSFFTEAATGGVL